MKIDVEGAEYDILQGAVHLLKHGLIKIIQFEYGGTYLDAGTSLKGIWNFIKIVNPKYKFYKIYPTKLKSIKQYSDDLETFLYSNWIIKL